MRALLERLAGLRQEAGALVEARSADDPTAADPLRGLYVSEDTARRLATEPEPDERPTGVGAWARCTGEGDDRMPGLAARFGLGELDVAILLAALAPDVHRSFEPLYGYLNDDVGRRRATVDLALTLAGSAAYEPEARGRFHPGAPLLDGGLLLVEEEERPLPGRQLRVPERVVAHLLGDDTLDAGLRAAGVTLQSPREAPAAAEGTVAARIAGPGSVRVHLRERRGGGADAVADALRGAGRTVLRHRPPATGQDPGVAHALVREARLRGAGTAIVVEPLPERPAELVRAMAVADVTVVFAGPGAYDPEWAPDAGLLAVDVQDVQDVQGGSSERDPVALWRAELPYTADDLSSIGDEELARAVAPYRLDGGQVRRAARAATALAAFEGVPLSPVHVQKSARLLSAPALERHARRVRPAVGFGDLVLPGEPLGLLKELAGRVRDRSTVLGQWRLRTGGGRGQGVVALFAGESGTGKTLAAEVIAGELGLDMYVVDLSAVVDKYVGETEKNLERIFTEADRTDAVLLFDEADAVFGKRSEVRSSHDRYANLESAYLLQRLEAFEGVAVLTTNLRANLDDAFTRRLDLVVDFPFPDVELRLALWRSSLAGVPQTDDLEAELTACAKEFELAGGAIRSAAVTAGYLAAAHGGPVTGADVRTGARREYVKMGRLVMRDTMPWAP
ncbi:ATP-binding protein [Streptomyces beijiangensis]|uniref:ATP-binding protein n=1 Tax=Streptomyces beijiangensis TaxID=163361 RepID=A0A939FCG8_9ACTN|nr:ATP-binding protein [Streptomyces beijiangensis]MBO0516535.1 ATP-binding protein [Streptomyces beijiangensis]